MQILPLIVQRKEDEMEELDQPTCGKGLAESSALPDLLGQFISAMGDVLDHHTQVLDLSDESSRREYEAYTSLVRQIRDISARLAAIAREMQGYRGLPMGSHDEEVMMNMKAVKVFEVYLTRKQDLLTFLQSTIEEDQVILDQMS
jgi:hypothetical protein